MNDEMNEALYEWMEAEAVEWEGGGRTLQKFIKNLKIVMNWIEFWKNEFSNCLKFMNKYNSIKISSRINFKMTVNFCEFFTRILVARGIFRGERDEGDNWWAKGGGDV